MRGDEKDNGGLHGNRGAPINLEDALGRMLSTRPWNLRYLVEHVAVRLRLLSPAFTGAVTHEYRDGYLHANIERRDGTGIPLVVRKYELIDPVKMRNDLCREITTSRSETPGLNFIAVVATRGGAGPELDATKLAEERIWLVHVPSSPPRSEAEVSLETLRASSIFLNKLN
jgi:hypothetical protein